jgi:hypothetical protein
VRITSANHRSKQPLPPRTAPSPSPRSAPGEYSVAVEYHGVTAASRNRSNCRAIPPSRTVRQLKRLSLIDEPQTHEATGGQKLSAKAVSELPLNKRDFSQLLLLAAGTMTDTNGAANFTQQFAVNGQRGTAAVFAMDGADSSDPEMGGATFTNFNVDAVEEIRSSSGWMPAEIGRGAAGFTDIVTRSGTNAIHGSCSSSCAMPRSMRAISSTSAPLRSRAHPAVYPQ